jgi:hypothetical protein
MERVLLLRSDMKTRRFSAPPGKAIAALVSGVLAFCTLETSIRAESPADANTGCGPLSASSVPVYDNDSIPANTPALLITESPPWEFISAKLLTPDAQTVAFTLTTSAPDHVLTLAQPLPIGDGYSLSWDSNCTKEAGAPQTARVKFNVGPAVDLPTTVGTVFQDTKNPSTTETTFIVCIMLIRLLPKAGCATVAHHGYHAPVPDVAPRLHAAFSG